MKHVITYTAYPDHPLATEASLKIRRSTPLLFAGAVIAILGFGGICETEKIWNVIFAVAGSVMFVGEILILSCRQKIIAHYYAKDEKMPMASITETGKVVCPFCKTENDIRFLRCIKCGKKYRISDRYWPFENRPGFR